METSRYRSNRSGGILGQQSASASAASTASSNNSASSTASTGVSITWTRSCQATCSKQPCLSCAGNPLSTSNIQSSAPAAAAAAAVAAAASAAETEHRIYLRSHRQRRNQQLLQIQQQQQQQQVANLTLRPWTRSRAQQVLHHYQLEQLHPSHTGVVYLTNPSERAASKTGIPLVQQLPPPPLPQQQQQQQQQQQNSSSSGSNSSGNNGGGSHLLSPPNSARTPTSASGWPSANQLFSSADFHSLGHLIQQTNSVTLSPAPSVSDGSGNSQGGSPSHAEQSAAAAAAAAAMAAQAHINFYTQALAQAHNQAQAAAANSAHHHHHQAGSNSGSQSDSEENDSVQDNSPARSPAPSTPIHLVPPPMSPLATTFSSAASSKTMDKDPLATTPLSDRGGGGGGDGLDSGSNGRLLWDFLQQLLNDPSQRYSHYIAWKNRETGVFKITDPAGLARLWGIQKNHPSMNYDKMSRALRYYYRVNILRKVQGERHCYQFLRNPIELKSIKNISLLRHQMAAAAAAAATTTSSATPATGSSGLSSTASSGKMADSTDASLERYSPSSSCNAPDQDFDAEPRTSRFANNNNNEQDPDDNDCEMPTDLSMERRGLNGTNPYLTTIKTENMAS